MLKSMQKNGLRLGLFALACTGLIVLTDYNTRDVIGAQQQLLKKSTLVKMLPADSYDTTLTNECHMLSSPYLGDTKPHPIYVARQKQQVSGYIIESVAPDGYSGAIRLLTGVSKSGEVQHVEVLEHHETPGLGDKIDRNKGNWLDSFTHQSLQSDNDSRWAVKKDGGQFDSFTGATITPRAIVKQLKNVLLLVRQHPELIEQAPACKAE
ncbi:electron transport complex subunit RsxG [Tolumonas lignilytica]|jgi:electron transport complex, RnfABCDGE type, G subunit|uniref:electron transport complex subunit RsxG n=1 Tax=Tolumonas lignilytica TaxID=1283284 RepID=UPI000465C06A|nr:electron transport complex subunit RsxG [Tolumonas lignilytica]